MNWLNKFRRKEDNKIKSVPSNKPALKSINYPPKIILAWSKAIEGNKEISNWLNSNGYQELVFASAAIHLKQDARDWLMQNGYAHLMAMINAAEGEEKAQKWLIKYKFNLLYHIAMVSEHENDSMIWLRKHATPDLFILAKTIRKIKDKIEENHNDIHSYGKDL